MPMSLLRRRESGAGSGFRDPGTKRRSPLAAESGEIVARRARLGQGGGASPGGPLRHAPSPEGEHGAAARTGSGGEPDGRAGAPADLPSKAQARALLRFQFRPVRGGSPQSLDDVEDYPRYG